MGRISTLKPRLKAVGSRLRVTEPGSWRSSAATSSERGYNYKWQKARATYLAANPFCVYCLRDAGIDGRQSEAAIIASLSKCMRLPYANVVDHKIPHRGDQALFWDQSNWQSLCATHHSRDKQREEAKSRAT